MARVNDTVTKTMFNQADPIIFERAKSLRLNQTEAERKLWGLLRKKQMLGLRFKPQHPISRFIVDFYCHKIKLAIEVDGSIHNLEEVKDKDINRTDELERLGLRVLRFTNEEINSRIEIVAKSIETKCKKLIEEEVSTPYSLPLNPLKGT